MKTISISVVKDDLARYLREAETEPIVITRHGKPAGLLIGFGSEEDWIDYRLGNALAFRRRIEAARLGIKAGRGTRLEDVRG